MDKIKSIIVEEVSLEGASGISWESISDLVKAREDVSLLLETFKPDFDSIREDLVSDGIIFQVRGDRYAVADDFLRFRFIGISHLPIIFENPQSLRIVELVARGRSRGAWSFAICSALRVDAKQLFHLSSVLVEFGIILRFSSVPIPRHLKSQSSGTNASFFILSRYASGSMDPDIADVVDPSHSTENVCALILALVREAGGVILSKALRTAVVVNGGFTNKQLRRGLERLSTSRRIDKVYVPESDEEGEDFMCDDEDDKTSSGYQGVHAIRLLTYLDEVSPAETTVVKEEEESLIAGTPIESGEEEVVEQESLIKYMRVRNFLRSKFSYKDSILSIIEASGSTGVTTRDISLLTGVGTKEVLKSMESLRANAELIDSVWRNDGKRKFIVYRLKTTTSKTNANSSSAGLTIKVDDDTDDPIITPPPTSSTGRGGYVTDQTVRRSVIAAEIVASRGALSLIDLGRAIEASEVAQGVGIPGTQIDRRTLKKICDISSIPLVEKGESSNTKLIIAFDPAQMTAGEACARVDRPVGITPKMGDVIKTPPAPLVTFRKISVAELSSRSRLAPLAVFGKAAIAQADPVSFKIAQIYGLVRSADIFKAKQIHHFLIGRFAPDLPVSINEVRDELPLLLYLQCIGCGVANAFIDEFFGSKNFQDLPIRQLPENVKVHLEKSVPSPPNVTGITQSAQLARVIAPLVKLNLVQIVKDGNKEVRYLISREGVVVAPSDGSSASEIASRVSFRNISEEAPSFPAVEEYWSNLLRVCMQWRRSAGAGVVAKNYAQLPQLFRRQQWRCKVVVTLSQRRELEALLRSYIARSSTESSLVIDGSNEELVRVCAKNSMDPGTALKALRQLWTLQADYGRSILVFATVNQARFRCGDCGQIFFQLSSIQRHFPAAHNRPAPLDISEFTRAEYVHALEKMYQPPTMDEKQKKRRRRRRGAPVIKQEEAMFEGAGQSDNDTEILKVYGLARRLVDEGNEDLVWQLTQRMMGEEKRSIAELQTRMVAPVVHQQDVVNEEGTKVQKISISLALNRMLDADMSFLESVCASNSVEFSQVQAARRTLTRSQRIALFGKYNEILKFMHLIESLVIERFESVVSLEEEPEHDSCVAACILDRLGHLSFDWQQDGREEEEDPDELLQETDENAYTGVKKHIALTQAWAGQICRVEAEAHANKKGEKSKGVEFLEELLRVCRSSSGSNLWRPTNTVQEGIMQDEETCCMTNSFSETATRLIAERKARTLDADNAVIYLAPPAQEAVMIPKILSLVFHISPKFFGLFAPLPNVPSILAAWTSLDGDLKPRVVADLLMHALLLVYSFPGISPPGLKLQLRLVTQQEVDCLVDVWLSSGIIMQNNHEKLFLLPSSHW